MRCRSLPRRRARWSALLVPALAITMFAAGCGGDQPVSPIGEQGAGPVGGATGTPGAASPQPVASLAGFTARTVAYLNADITVTEVEASQQTPRSYGNEPAEYGEATYAYLTVTVANRLNYTTVLINDGIFLDVAGDLVPRTGGKNPATGIVSAGATATGWYAFELPPGAVLAEAALVLGEPGQRQERLPLTGAVPEPEFPRTVTVPSPGTVLVRNSCPLEVEVTEAYLAHWVGFDDNGRSHTTSQAEADRLKLYLGIDVTAPPGSRSCFIASGSGDVHLVVDGVRLGDNPQLRNTTNVAEGTTASQYLVYDIPASGQVEIEWGRLGGEQQRTPVPLP